MIVQRQEMDLYNEYLELPNRPTEPCSAKDFKLELEIQSVITGKEEFMTYSEQGTKQQMRDINSSEVDKKKQRLDMMNKAVKL